MMRLNDDQTFAELLNRFYTASQTEEDIKFNSSGSIDPSDVNYPSDDLHIWAKTNPVNRHKEMILHQILAQLFLPITIKPQISTLLNSVLNFSGFSTQLQKLRS